MDDYISREEAIAAIKEIQKEQFANEQNESQSWNLGFQNGLNIARRDIADIPAANVRPVVMCRDCELWGSTLSEEDRQNCVITKTDLVCDYWMSDGLLPDDFCSYGKKRGADMRGDDNEKN